MNDIPILYRNETGSTDFEVLVFTKNFTPNTVNTYYCAWQVLRAQTTVAFKYPVEISVGVHYKTNGGLLNTAGPFRSALGSTWQITQEKGVDTPVLEEIKSLPRNPDNNIVVRNVQSTCWAGRKFDVGIYKSGRLLVTEPDVHTDNQVNFMLQPKLFFAVARNIRIGDVFTSLEWTSSYEVFDLSKYPDGMIVTLTEQPGGGKYSFSATEMCPFI